MIKVQIKVPEVKKTNNFPKLVQLHGSDSIYIAQREGSGRGKGKILVTNLKTGKSGFIYDSTVKDFEGSITLSNGE